MREICILAGFFLVVMATTCAAGYSVLFKEEKEDSESPLVETLRRIGAMAPLRPKESDRLLTGQLAWHDPAGQPS